MVQHNTVRCDTHTQTNTTPQRRHTPLHTRRRNPQLPHRHNNTQTLRTNRLHTNPNKPRQTNILRHLRLQNAITKETESPKKSHARPLPVFLWFLFVCGGGDIYLGNIWAMDGLMGVMPRVRCSCRSCLDVSPAQTPCMSAAGYSRA